MNLPETQYFDTLTTFGCRPIIFSNVIKLGISTFIAQMSIVIISLVCNIELAKYYAKEFADYLKTNVKSDKTFEYPKTERPVTDKGDNFYDS